MISPLRTYHGKAAAASVFIGFFLAASAALGQGGVVLEPQVEQILLDSCNFLKSASEFEFSADVTYDEVESTGQKIQYGATFTTSVKRPDRLRSIYKGDLEKRSIWYDGRRLTLLDGVENLFASTQAPPRIDEFLDLAVSQLGFAIPGADLLYSNPFPVLNGNVERGYYAGLHSVNGIPCHHLAFSQDDIDWQIWIEAGETMVPRKLTITYKDLPGSPQYTAVFPAWDFSPSLLDEQFSFRPPAGAEKIDFLLPGKGGKGTP